MWKSEKCERTKGESVMPARRAHISRYWNMPHCLNTNKHAATLFQSTNASMYVCVWQVIKKILTERLKGGECKHKNPWKHIKGDNLADNQKMRCECVSMCVCVGGCLRAHGSWMSTKWTRCWSLCICELIYMQMHCKIFMLLFGGATGGAGWSASPFMLTNSAGVILCKQRSLPGRQYVPTSVINTYWDKCAYLSADADLHALAHARLDITLRYYAAILAIKHSIGEELCE